MNFEEVKKLPRAQHYNMMVWDLLKIMDTPAATAMHAGVGISGEVSELTAAVIVRDDANIVEESGDIQFYAQGLCNLYGFKRDDIMLVDVKHAEVELFDWCWNGSESDGMAFYAGQILDVLKQPWAYNKPLSLGDLEYNLGMFYRFFQKQLSEFDLTFDDIEAHNQYKLATGPNARYPSGKYSDAQAVARADKVSE